MATATETYNDAAQHTLPDGNLFYTGLLPDCVVFDRKQLEEVWAMHPDEYHLIMMHGREVPTPRWQQAYERDYHYTGRVNGALPAPAVLKPLLAWAQEYIDHQLNGLLLNWYDGKIGHYIGAHRDSTTNMVNGAPIVTLSFGEERIFRLRPWKRKGYHDFTVVDGSVCIMAYETNLAWTHEVPHFKRYKGRRISVTLRSFEKT